MISIKKYFLTEFIKYAFILNKLLSVLTSVAGGFGFRPQRVAQTRAINRLAAIFLRTYFLLMEIISIITLYRKQTKHHSPPLMPARMLPKPHRRTLGGQETGAWVPCQEGNKVCGCYGEKKHRLTLEIPSGGTNPPKWKVRPQAGMSMLVLQQHSPQQAKTGKGHKWVKGWCHGWANV